MHVPVDDEHTRTAERLTRVLGGDGAGVEDAEAHGHVRLGVVPWRAHQRHPILCAAGHDGVRQVEHGAARTTRCVKREGIEINRLVLGDKGVDLAELGRDRRLDAVPVVALVHQRHLLARHQPAGHPHRAPCREALVFERIHHRGEALGTLRMVTVRVAVEAHRLIKEQHRRRRAVCQGTLGRHRPEREPGRVVAYGREFEDHGAGRRTRRRGGGRSELDNGRDVVGGGCVADREPGEGAIKGIVHRRRGG